MCRLLDEIGQLPVRLEDVVGEPIADEIDEVDADRFPCLKAAFIFQRRFDEFVVHGQMRFLAGEAELLHEACFVGEMELGVLQQRNENLRDFVLRQRSVLGFVKFVEKLDKPLVLGIDGVFPDHQSGRPWQCNILGHRD